MTRRANAGDGHSAPDPVAAFWLKMAHHARTEGLRELHEHLAKQRSDFLVYQRERRARAQRAG